MTEQTVDRNLCQLHSGVCKTLSHLEHENNCQWEAIRSTQNSVSSIKNWLIGVLVAVCMNLLSVLFLLLRTH